MRTSAVAMTAVLLLFSGVTRGFAQGVCTPSSAPTQVRAEGAVEALGPIVLTCTGIVVTPTTLTVAVGAALIPASLTPDNIESFPLPTIASTIGFSIAPVVSVDDNSATFSFTPAAGAQTFVISGIRANIAGSGLPVGGQITASIRSSEISLFRVSPLTLIGIVANGLGSGSGFPDNPLNIVACSPAVSTPTGEPATVSGNPDPSSSAGNSLKVTLVEGFRNTFLTAANEDGGNGGLQGTRFRIRLADIPSGIIPYAPRTIRVTSAGTTGTVSPVSSLTVIRRVGGAEEDGSGGAVLGEVADQFDKIEVSDGNATIVYEVMTDSPATIDTVTLFIALTASGTLTRGNAVASLSLAPLGPPTEAPARPQFAPSTAISLNPTGLTFNAFVDNDPAPQTFEITNPGAGVLNWTASITSITGGDWLTLSRTSGVGNNSITASVESSSLLIGTYKATVTLSSAEAINSPRTLPVTLYVSSRLILAVNPSSFNFTSLPGGNAAPQQLTINSSCCATNWAATVETSSGGNWLNISPSLGSTATLASVTVNTAGLIAGTYQGSIRISAPEAPNSPQTVSVSLTVGGSVVGLNPASLVFITSVGNALLRQTFNIQNAGMGVLGWTASVATHSGGDWLSVSPSTGVAPSMVEVSVNTGGLPAGAYAGTVTVAAIPGSNSPQVLNVGLAVDASTIAQNGIVNGASLSGDSVVSPGLLAALFGTKLADTTAIAGNVSVLPAILAGTQVLVNGIPAPLFYVSPTQINFHVPVNIAGSSVEVVVVSNGIAGLPTSVRLVPHTPGIFTVVGGAGQGAVLNEDSTPNSAGNPARAGSVVQLFAAGLGTVTPQVPAGQAAGTSPLSRTDRTPEVLIGGRAAQVEYSGLAPGLVGVYQVNAIIPPEIQGGSIVPVEIRIGAGSSNVVTIGVR